MRWLRAIALSAVILSMTGGRSSAAAPAGGARAKKQAPYDGAEAAKRAGVTNPHSHNGLPFCARCHEPGHTLTYKDPIALCADCHDVARMRHPFRTEQAPRPGDLPLMPGGLVACHTCHDPHAWKARKSGLRLEYGALCLRCHAGREKGDPHRPHPHGANAEDAASPAEPGAPSPAR